MATRTTTETTTTTETPVVPTPDPTLSLAELRARKKAIEDAIEAAPAAESSKDGLAAETAKQETTPNKALVWRLMHYRARRAA